MTPTEIRREISIDFRRPVVLQTPALSSKLINIELYKFNMKLFLLLLSRNFFKIAFFFGFFWYHRDEFSTRAFMRAFFRSSVRNGGIWIPLRAS